jgi:hypothetical protein
MSPAYHVKSTVSNLAARPTRLRNTATVLRNRQVFHRGRLTELASTGFESLAEESFEIATKIAYRNGERLGTPKAGAIDCTMIAGAGLCGKCETDC